jgi:hypothetical protein
MAPGTFQSWMCPSSPLIALVGPPYLLIDTRQLVLSAPDEFSSPSIYAVGHLRHPPSSSPIGPAIPIELLEKPRLISKLGSKDAKSDASEDGRRTNEI